MRCPADRLRTRGSSLEAWQTVALKSKRAQFAICIRENQVKRKPARSQSADKAKPSLGSALDEVGLKARPRRIVKAGDRHPPLHHGPRLHRDGKSG